MQINNVDHGIEIVPTLQRGNAASDAPASRQAEPLNIDHGCPFSHYAGEDGLVAIYRLW